MNAITISIAAMVLTAALAIVVPATRYAHREVAALHAMRHGPSHGIAQ